MICVSIFPCQWSVSAYFHVSDLCRKPPLFKTHFHLIFKVVLREGIHCNTHATRSIDFQSTGRQPRMNKEKRHCRKHVWFTFFTASSFLSSASFSQQAASLSGRGFYGCMRNVLINGKLVDWYKLEITSSLLRTACPLWAFSITPAFLTIMPAFLTIMPVFPTIMPAFFIMPASQTYLPSSSTEESLRLFATEQLWQLVKAWLEKLKLTTKGAREKNHTCGKDRVCFSSLCRGESS